METGGLPRTFGDFRFEREAGRGAMGVVYEAQQVSTGRRCAVKLLAAHVHADDEAVERFRREGQLAGSIAHPRTVFVYAADEVEGQPYIAMEWMSGGTLKDVVEAGGPMPVTRAVDCALHVLDGLLAAAEAGVVHRDVKPSNCFLDADGSVKVGDFGLAKSLRAGFDLTLTGEFIGTPYFASPEQVRGRDLDPRSDQYSLAATLFYLLCGRPMFPGTHAGDVLGAIVSDRPPSLLALRKDVPRGLDRVIRRALAKDPADRYPDFEAFRRALLPYATQTLTPAARGPRFFAWLVDLWLIVAATDAVRGLASLLAAGMALDGLPLQGALTLAYFTLFEGFIGRTPGKALMGLAVARRPHGEVSDLRVPALGTSLHRTSLYVAGMVLGLLVPRLLTHGTSAGGESWLGPEGWAELGSWNVPGALLLACTMRRRNGWRGLHELLSHTFVYHRAQEERPVRRKVVTLPPLAAVPDPELPAQLGTFEIRGVLARPVAGSGALLLGRDPSLGRAAWIVLRPPNAPPLPVARRDLRRGLRLRWLGAGHGVSGRWDAFEAPEGGALAEVVRRGGPLPWTEARLLLLGLAEELRAAARDDTLPAPLTLDHVWLTPGGRLRLLDVVPADAVGPASAPSAAPAAALAAAAAAAHVGARSSAHAGLAGESPAAAAGAAPLAAADERALLVFLSEVAVALVGPAARPGRGAGAGDPRRLPLPRHAADTLLALRDNRTLRLDDALERLHKLTRRTASVTRGMRIIEALPVALLLLLTATLGVLSADRADEPPVLLAALAVDEGASLPAPDEAVREVLHAACVVLARSDLDALAAANVLGEARSKARGVFNLEPHVQWSQERAAAELQRAREACGSPGDPAVADAQGLLLSWNERHERTALMAGVATGFLVLMVMGALGAFVARGGLLLNLIDVDVHTRERGRAGRWRCAWRAAATWLMPLGFALAAVVEVTLAASLWRLTGGLDVIRLDFAPRAAFVPADVLLGLSGLALLFVLVLPVWRPRHSVQDALARTQLLPR